MVENETNINNIDKNNDKPKVAKKSKSFLYRRKNKNKNEENNDLSNNLNNSNSFNNKSKEVSHININKTKNNYKTKKSFTLKSSLIIEDFKEEIQENENNILLTEEEKQINILKYEIFNHIKKKTGKNKDNLINNLIKLKKLDIQINNLANSSKTNLLGMCLIYDDYLSWEELIYNFNSLEEPLIWGENLLSISFSKSKELNEKLINFYLENKNINKLLKEFYEKAPLFMFRQENVILYLEKIVNINEKEQFNNFVIDCFKLNNKSILYELSQNKKYINFLKENIIYSQDNSTKIWVTNLINNNSLIKKNNKTKTIINNNNSNNIISNTTHLSSKEDKVRQLSGKENKTQIITKKRLIKG